MKINLPVVGDRRRANICSRYPEASQFGLEPERNHQTRQLKEHRSWGPDGVFTEVLAFAIVDEIQRYDHSNETSLPVLSHGPIYFSAVYKL